MCVKSSIHFDENATFVLKVANHTSLCYTVSHTGELLERSATVDIKVADVDCIWGFASIVVGFGQPVFLTGGIQYYTWSALAVSKPLLP